MIFPDPGFATDRLRRLERLQDVCRIASSSLRLDQALPLLCRAVRDALGFDRVAIYRIDPRAQRIVGPVATAPPLAEPVGAPGDAPPEPASLDLRRGASAAADVALGLIPYALCNEAADVDQG